MHMRNFREEITEIRERNRRFAAGIDNLCKDLETSSDIDQNIINNFRAVGNSIYVDMEDCLTAENISAFISKNVNALYKAQETNFLLIFFPGNFSYDKRLDKCIESLIKELLELENLIAEIIVGAREYLLLFN